MPRRPRSAYRLCLSERNRRQLEEWAEQAKQLGILDQYVVAVKAIHQRLTRDPLTCGDPNYRLRHAGLIMCHGICAPLHVYYAVDEARRIVYVKEFQPLPGQPFSHDG